MQDASLWEIRELFGTKHLELLAYVEVSCSYTITAILVQ